MRHKQYCKTGQFAQGPANTEHLRPAAFSFERRSGACITSLRPGSPSACSAHSLRGCGAVLPRDCVAGAVLFPFHAPVRQSRNSLNLVCNSCRAITRALFSFRSWPEMVPHRFVCVTTMTCVAVCANVQSGCGRPNFSSPCLFSL